jgi:hypothetical protein
MAVCTFRAGPIVTLNLLGNAYHVFHVAVFGDKGWAHHLVDAGTAYYDGMTIFMETLRTGKWPLTRDQLLEPIKVLSAVKRSLAARREVSLNEFD